MADEAPQPEVRGSAITPAECMLYFPPRCSCRLWARAVCMPSYECYWRCSSFGAKSKFQVKV